MIDCAYVPDHTVAQNQFGLYAVPVSSAYTLTSQAVLSGRVHEPDTINFIIENSAKGDIIHAGAGFGDFLPALGMNCCGIIWAFEPNSENYICAHKTIELNALNNIKLQNIGLGEFESEKYLKVRLHNQSLGPRTETTEFIEWNKDLEKCKIQTIDQAVRSDNVSLIHLDTEGYEFEVLKGAKETINRFRPLIVLEIDGKIDGLSYNSFMRSINYAPVKQLIYDAGELVFVNTVYAHNS